jgi:hypothetical protein
MVRREMFRVDHRAQSKKPELEEICSRRRVEADPRQLLIVTNQRHSLHQWALHGHNQSLLVKSTELLFLYM